MSATPHSPHAELAIVGAALLKPEIATWLEVEPDDFFGPRGRACWGAIRRLVAAGRAVDTLTLEGQLEADGTLKAVGLEYLSEAAVLVPTAENVEEYARDVRKHALTRRAMQVCSEALQEARDGLEEGEALVSLLLERLAALTASQRDSAQSIGEAVKAALVAAGGRMERRARGEDVVAGIPTGIGVLDHEYGGVPIGVLSVLAGRPSMGKSSMARGIAMAANSAGLGAHVFSCEDSSEVYALRAISSESGVAVNALVAGRLTRDEFRRVQKASGQLYRRERYLLDERGGLTADEIVRSVRRHAVPNATKLVVVDYAQLLAWHRGAKNMHEAISHMTRTLATAAKQDGIAYLLLSQLNRQSESRPDKRPLMSDLRESGSLEEHSRCVIFMHRPSKYGECDEYGDPVAESVAEIIVAKYTNGPTGTVRCRWDGATTTFRSEGERCDP